MSVVSVEQMQRPEFLTMQRIWEEKVHEGQCAQSMDVRNVSEICGRKTKFRKCSEDLGLPIAGPMSANDNARIMLRWR